MICLCVRITCTSKERNNNKQEKVLPTAEITAMLSRDWPDSDAIVHPTNLAFLIDWGEGKKWFIISTEQREYRASAMQWTCWAYQSLGNMESFLFKGWKWRADGRKPKQKTSVQNLVFFSFVNDYTSKTVQ